MLSSGNKLIKLENEIHNVMLKANFIKFDSYFRNKLTGRNLDL